MAEYDVGYCKPPKSGRFKPGTSGNPAGRSIRRPTPIGEIVKAIVNSLVSYRENGRSFTTTRRQFRIMKLVERAIKGDVNAAGQLIQMRAQAFRRGEAVTQQLIITDWLPDYPGQTAAQKTQEHRAAERTPAGPDQDAT